MNDDNPRHPYREADGASNDPKRPDDTEPLIVTIEPQAKNPYSYEAKTYRLERARYRLEKKAYHVGYWTMVFLMAYTGLTLVVAASSVIATIYTKRAANAASKQADMMRQQMVGMQAAVLDYSTPTWSGPAEGDLIEMLVNHGLVSAKDASLDITITHERLSDFQPLEPPFTLHNGSQVVRAGDKFVLEWHMPWKMKVIPDLLQDWPKDWPGTEVTKINGVYTYNNGFDDVVKKEFCFRWLPAFNYAMPNGSQGIGGMDTCDDTLSFIQWSLAKRKEIDAKRKATK